MLALTNAQIMILHLKKWEKVEKWPRHQYTSVILLFT